MYHFQGELADISAKKEALVIWFFDLVRCHALAPVQMQQT